MSWMSKPKTRHQPNDSLPITSGDFVPRFCTIDNPIDHLVGVHELFLQDSRPDTPLPAQHGIQEESILGKIDEFWIPRLEKVF